MCFCTLFLVLQGSASCEIENHGGVVTLRPLPGCVCLLNDREVTEPCRLAQGQFMSSTDQFTHNVWFPLHFFHIHMTQIGYFVMKVKSKKPHILMCDMSLLDMQAYNLNENK